ncbi:MAG: hypothetical protein ACKVLN_11675, partial [Rhodobacterales bacterium]
IKAQINEFTDREETMTKSAADRTSRCGVVLLAAAKATGIAITIAMIVPMLAMFIVSQAGFHNCDI